MRVIFFTFGVLLLIGTAKGEGKDPFPITAVPVGEDKVKLKCEKGARWTFNDNVLEGNELTLDYKDDMSGNYKCFRDHTADDNDDEIISEKKYLGSYYVKFRTCENCIELDEVALAGIIIGNVVASVLIGVAVYFISTQSKGPSFPSNKASKESDRRNLISNDQTYQPLATHGRDDYDVLHTRRR